MNERDGTPEVVAERLLNGSLVGVQSYYSQKTENDMVDHSVMTCGRSWRMENGKCGFSCTEHQLTRTGRRHPNCGARSEGH